MNDTAMNLNRFQVFQYAKYKAKFGELSKDECLTLALEAENIMKSLQPGDIARTKFYTDQEELFNYSFLIEQLGLKSS